MSDLTKEEKNRLEISSDEMLHAIESEASDIELLHFSQFVANASKTPTNL